MNEIKSKLQQSICKLIDDQFRAEFPCGRARIGEPISVLHGIVEFGNSDVMVAKRVIDTARYVLSDIPKMGIRIHPALDAVHLSGDRIAFNFEITYFRK